MVMENIFEKPYDPKEHETKIYELWEKSGFFNPDKLPNTKNEKTFTIMMPPPNVTGVLHMGHALALTLQDIMARYHRMQGQATLYLPGTDHAAIATQSKVEKEIKKKENKSRYDLGREKLLRRIEQFAKTSHDTIVAQTKAMGASCDWSREAFTLDEKRTLAVRTMFKKMYDDDLIYRGNRIVNWDPKGQTTISDDEIIYEERRATLYTFKYDKDFPIEVSTTRPETKVGDTAVAVHPADDRYKKYVGQTFKANICGVDIEVKIIADESVDKDFGTGALGVTPAHSMIDWEIAQRHSLPIKQVIDERARMTVGDGRLLGKKTTEAREAIIAWLREENLLTKEEDVSQNVATAERTGGIIEPLPKLQWFIDVNKPFVIQNSKIKGIASGSQTTLKEIMRKPVENGQIKIVPEYFTKTYFHWIENLRDWCISRQIWYGHRIPVWYKNDDINCGIEAPRGEGWIQDEDTLDTWFSSGLWTFSTLGWPEKTKDLELYHPTNVLETGYEILFFWVARMILMTGYALGDIPFETVYLHGTVRDQQGRKMSKSLGNGIDPIDVADQFGADAGRMALVVGNTPGTDLKIWPDKIRGYKHFANKIWNITRFVLANAPANLEKSDIQQEERKYLDELKKITKSVTDDMENFRFYIAADTLYHYVWNDFADVILENSKKRMKAEDAAIIASAQWTNLEILKTSLKLLHPLMPFITETIWQELRSRKLINSEMLMIEQWPSISGSTND